MEGEHVPSTPKGREWMKSATCDELTKELHTALDCIDMLIDWSNQQTDNVNRLNSQLRAAKADTQRAVDEVLRKAQIGWNYDRSTWGIPISQKIDWPEDLVRETFGEDAVAELCHRPREDLIEVACAEEPLAEEDKPRQQPQKAAEGKDGAPKRNRRRRRKKGTKHLGAEECLPAEREPARVDEEEGIDGETASRKDGARQLPDEHEGQPGDELQYEQQEDQPEESRSVEAPARSEHGGGEQEPGEDAPPEDAPEVRQRREEGWRDAPRPVKWADDDDLLDVPAPAPRHPAPRDASHSDGGRQGGSQQAAACGSSSASYSSRSQEFWTCPHCALCHFSASVVCGNPACRSKARSPGGELRRGMTSLGFDDAQLLGGGSAPSDGPFGVQSADSTVLHRAGHSSATGCSSAGTGCWGSTSGLDGYWTPYSQCTDSYGQPQRSGFLPQLHSQPDLPQLRSVPLQGQLQQCVYAQPVHAPTPPPPPDLYEMGMQLHPRVAELCPAQADKVTGMLLDRGVEFAAAVLSDADLLVQAVTGARLTLERAEGALRCASAPAPAQYAAPQEKLRKLYVPPSARRQLGL